MTPKYPESDPIVPTKCPLSTPKVIPEYPQSDLKVPPKDSQGNYSLPPKLLKKHLQSNNGVLPKFIHSIFKITSSTLATTPWLPQSDPWGPLQWPQATLKVTSK